MVSKESFIEEPVSTNFTKSISDFIGIPGSSEAR